MKISDPTSGIVDRNGACNKQNKSKSLFSLATKTYAMIASNRVKKVCQIYTSIHRLKNGDNKYFCIKNSSIQFLVF